MNEKRPELHLCGFLIAGPVVHSHAIWRNPKHGTAFLSLAHYVRIAQVLEHVEARDGFDLLHHEIGSCVLHHVTDAGQHDQLCVRNCCREGPGMNVG